MTGQVEPSAQGQAAAEKPKFTLLDVIRSARTPEEMLPLVAAAFPNTTMVDWAKGRQRAPV